MERYSVIRREPVVTQIEAAIEASGGRVIERPDPKLAPFMLKVAFPDGRVVELICYAFTANKYRQDGRPADEHRFQIKYGSDFDRYHRIYLAPERTRITLMFSVHLELGLFIAVDPRMHTPTWFSSSVEMKEADLEQARIAGWHGWERERSKARRKKDMPQENLSTEVLIGFRPEHFLKYVDLEAHAGLLDPGERLLLSDRIERAFAEGRSARPQHILEAQLELSASEILDLIHSRFRLHAAVRGGVAELHLGRHLQHVKGVSDVRSIDEDGRPDFQISYRRQPVRIECKNVLARPSLAGPVVDFQKTRASKSNPCSRYYEGSQFEVLAACLHPITERWEFKFSLTSTLEPHRTCPGRLSARVIVAGPGWEADLPMLLDRPPA